MRIYLCCADIHMSERKIPLSVFDVPILAQVAAVLFETLDAGAEVSLNQILARVESVELGNCVTELAQAGLEKGNFESRLADAMKTIARYQAQKQNSGLKAEENESEFLRSKHKNAGGQNRHIVGMVE